MTSSIIVYGLEPTGAAMILAFIITVVLIYYVGRTIGTPVQSSPSVMGLLALVVAVVLTSAVWFALAMMVDFAIKFFGSFLETLL